MITHFLHLWLCLLPKLVIYLPFLVWSGPGYGRVKKDSLHSKKCENEKLDLKMCPSFNYLRHFSTIVHTSCRSESSKYELGHFDSCNNKMFCCLLSFHTIHSLYGIILRLFITQITLKNIWKQKSWLENSSLFAFFGAIFSNLLGMFAKGL